jgi:citrate synthase
VSELIRNNEPVMGFGHRVYETSDPRSTELMKMARQLSLEKGDTVLWDTAQSVVEAMKPYAEKGLDVNVDFYASIVYHLLGIPQDLFVAVFAAARMPGWISQVKEQYDNNILIRPLLQYVGETDLPFVQIDQRRERSELRYAEEAEIGND